MAEVVTGVPQLQRRLKAISGIDMGEKMMGRLGLSTVREAKLLVHRKTGNLGRSIHIKKSRSATNVIVEAGARYAAFVEFGTKAHEITPNAKKALRWAATPAGRRLTGTPRKAAQRGQLGGVVFAKRVHHPGTKPYPYLLPGAKLAVSKSGLKDAIIEEWNGAA